MIRVLCYGTLSIPCVGLYRCFKSCCWLTKPQLSRVSLRTWRFWRRKIGWIRVTRQKY